MPIGRNVCLILPLLLALLALLVGCEGEKREPGVYQGYLEARFLGVAAPTEGRLVKLDAKRGEWVEAGAPLFALQLEPEADQVREAAQRVAAAEARVADLRKGLRESEIAALESRLAADRAALELANLEWKRSQPLKEGEFVSAHEFDRLRITVDESQARAAQAAADLTTGKLGAREDQIVQAAADLAAAEAARDRARWLLGEKTQAAPQAGWVQDTLFRIGERVAPGQPVVVLLPAAEMRVRFFVPQTEINQIRPGQNVLVSLDGLEPVPATVSFVSTQVEYTPPVIYSRRQNYKYVFMVEADFAPEVARTLHAGQPAEVRLAPAP